MQVSDHDQVKREPGENPGRCSHCEGADDILPQPGDLPVCGISDLLPTDRLSHKDCFVIHGKMPQQCGFYCRKGKCEMKKLIMLVAVVTMLALVLTACGGSKPKDETQTTAVGGTETQTAAGAEDVTKAEEKLEDGTFKVEVAMEGGTGKASIKSPATVVVKGGKATAVIIWDSDKYDYMMVDGKKYEPITTEGGSTFKIPVLAFDEPFTVIGDTTAMSTPHEVEYTLTFDSAGLKESTADVDAEIAADKAAAELAAEMAADKAAAEKAADKTADAQAEKKDEKADEKAAVTSDVLEDGTYLAEFDTDSSMFHVNEAKDGKGELTVKDGNMTIHISLVSKKIVNLFPGTAEEAQEKGAVLLEPTTDTVTYSDGMSEEVYGFDVPVPALDEEFDLAILGESGTWFDHIVSVSNPEPAE